MANKGLCAVGTQSPHLQLLIGACSALSPAAASQLQTVMAGLASITILIPEQWNMLLAELQVREIKHDQATRMRLLRVKNLLCAMLCVICALDNLFCAFALSRCVGLQADVHRMTPKLYEELKQIMRQPGQSLSNRQAEAFKRCAAARCAETTACICCLWCTVVPAPDTGQDLPRCLQLCKPASAPQGRLPG